MARVTSQIEDQGAESAPFAAGFEALPLRVGVVDLPQSIRWGSARRIGGDLVARDSGLTQDARARVPPLKDAPACDKNDSSTGAIQNGESDLPN